MTSAPPHGTKWDLDSPSPPAPLPPDRAWLARTTGGAFDPWPLVLACASLLAGLPFLRLVAWFGDEGVLFHAAQRVLRGEVLYRDVFAFLPPGSYLLVTGWAALFGASLLSLRLLAQGVIAACVVLSYLVCRPHTRSRALALAPALCLLLGAQGDWAVVNHHWFTTLLGLGALALLQVQRSNPAALGPPLWAGILAGAALTITHSRGGLFGLASAGALLWPSMQRRSFAALRPVLAFAVGGVILPVACALWVVQQGAARDAVAGIFAFAGTHYARIQSVRFGAGVGPQHAPLVWLFPVLGVAVLLCGARRLFGRRGGPPADSVADAVESHRTGPPLLELLFAGAGFLGCYPRPDVIHVLFNAALAFPLLCWFAERLRLALRRLTRGRLGWLVSLALLAVCLSVAPTYLALARATRDLRSFPSARGAFLAGGFVDPAEFAGLSARLQTLPREAPFFFYPYLPMLPYLEARPHVAALDLFTPGYTTAAQYQRTCREVLARATYLVIDRRWLDPTFLRAIWPALADADPPEVRALHQALEAGFSLVERWGRYELRQRNAAPAACAPDR